jgi:cytoskeleton protein RodZ
MNEPLPGATDPSWTATPGGGESARTAGAMLKAAREREGLHLAVLAATIKVTPAKLEALEQDRYAELPNATFARALAQSVCRSLKIDPRPVLALLPQLDAPPLEGAMGKLNTPFQDRPSRSDGVTLNWASKPLYWMGGLLLLAALVVGFLPPEWVERARQSWASSETASPSSVAVPVNPQSAATAPTSATPLADMPGARSDGASTAELQPNAGAALASAPAAAASVAAGLLPTPAEPPAASTFTGPAANVATAATAASANRAGQSPGAGTAVPALAATPAPAASALAVAPPVTGLLQLATTAASWVEVIDARGEPVFSRVIEPGERVGLNPALPVRLRVGNVRGTELSFRSRPFDLAPYTRDNVARVELR